MQNVNWEAKLKIEINISIHILKQFENYSSLDIRFQY